MTKLQISHRPSTISLQPSLLLQMPTTRSDLLSTHPKTSHGIPLPLPATTSPYVTVQSNNKCPSPAPMPSRGQMKNTEIAIEYRCAMLGRVGGMRVKRAPSG